MSLGYETYGSGSHKVIVLHGWFGDETFMRPMRDALDGAEFTYIFPAYRGYGAAGCNNWTATVWPVRGQRLVAGGFSLTRKTCPGGAVAFQNAYLSVLGAGATWDLVNDDLVVKSPRGVLKFQRGL